MTREEAKAWFEALLANEQLADEVRPAYEQAVVALMQPKFIAVKEGEFAVLECDWRPAAEHAAAMKAAWERYTGAKCIVLDPSLRLVGSVAEGAQPLKPLANVTVHGAGIEPDTRATVKHLGDLTILTFSDGREVRFAPLDGPL